MLDPFFNMLGIKQSHLVYALVGGLVYAIKASKTSWPVRVLGGIAGVLLGVFVGPGLAQSIGQVDENTKNAIVCSVGIFGASVVEVLLYLIRNPKEIAKIIRAYRRGA